MTQGGSAAAPSLSPMGRPSADSNLRLPLEEWWLQLCAAVAAASQVQIATCMFDDNELFKLLLRRLVGRSAFNLSMCLDSETFLKGTTPAVAREGG